ncbi:MAG: heparan-alpha-glucosaminide N-acetyltransferase domain-containing protein [Bacillota bacterium]
MLSKRCEAEPIHIEQSHKVNRRIESVDLTRGIIVLLSLFLGTLPSGSYKFLHHADWYGMTMTDLIFPAFMTLFGTGMAIAYFTRVKWKKLIKRTISFILLGLIFNMIVGWNIDLTTLRFTGVLQLFAVTGLLLVLLTRILHSWQGAMLAAIIITSLHTGLLLGTSQECQSGLPQPECNIGITFDKSIVGNDHLYWDGQRGYDPEGILTIPGAFSNVLLGYAAGMLIMRHRRNKTSLMLGGLAVTLGAIGYITSLYLPINKRLWTGSFTLTSAAVTIGFLALMYLLFDESKHPSIQKLVNKPIWLIEAFGRNSLLIYFGKFILVAGLVNISIDAGISEDTSLYYTLLHWVEAWSAYPALTFAGLFLLFWTMVAAMLHKLKWYIRL